MKVYAFTTIEVEVEIDDKYKVFDTPTHLVPEIPGTLIDECYRDIVDALNNKYGYVDEVYNISNEDGKTMLMF